MARWTLAAPLALVLACGRAPAREPTVDEPARRAPPIDASASAPDADASPPDAAPPRAPVAARILSVSVRGSDAIVTLDRGSDAGVTPGTRGYLLAGNGKRIAGSDFVVERVTTSSSIFKLVVTDMVLTAQTRALLELE